MKDYAGTYELVPGRTMIITRQADKLHGQRGTDPAKELVPESPDVFFRSGIEGRRFLHRNASGEVDFLIDRRNNEDLIWKKVQ